jgi:hypothetical protein
MAPPAQERRAFSLIGAIHSPTLDQTNTAMQLLFSFVPLQQTPLTIASGNVRIHDASVQHKRSNK